MGGWKLATGKRWNDATRDRVSRLFRHHVQSAWNPKGRIVRLPCAYCHDGEQLQTQPSEAHHIDYDYPFVMVWVCKEHHRRVERGELPITRRRICDYSSLVANIVKLGNRVQAVKKLPTLVVAPGFVADEPPPF